MDQLTILSRLRTAVYPDGECFKWLAKESYLGRWSDLGTWPALEGILMMPAFTICETGVLFALGAEISHSSAKIHVKSGFDTKRGEFPFLAVLLSVSALRTDWPVGSIGSVAEEFADDWSLTHWIGDRSWVGDVTLGYQVGGDVAYPALPVLGEMESIDAYNWAVIAYWTKGGGLAQLKGDSFNRPVCRAIESLSVAVEVPVEKKKPLLQGPVVAEVEVVDTVGVDSKSEVFEKEPELVSDKTLRNRQWRREKKERKKRRQGFFGPVRRSGRQGFFSECSEEVQQVLRQSRAELLVEQNKLALLKAKRGLKVLEDSDVNEEVRRYRTSIRASTEKNMVSIEKTHATLKSTGNVPGFAETVVSDGGVSTPGLSTSGLTADGTVSCSITPDSSASQAEFRACQKALLDSEKQVLELKEALKKLGVTVSMSKNLDKETFTDDTVGNDLFAEFYPQGEVVHYVDRGGKKKFKVGEEYVVHDFKKMKETMGDKAWNEFLRT